ncbi:MAG: hypothetical protein ABIR16_09215 [Dokdonella sp.]
MNPISDDELILYHYRDGLEPSRLAKIATALESAGELRERYRRLVALLDRVDAVTTAEPDESLAARTWERLAPRLDAAHEGKRNVDTHGVRRARAPHKQRTRWHVPIVFSAAASLMIAVAIGYQAGRQSAPSPSPLTQTALSAKSGMMAARVLDAYVAEHLRATEGVLLTAANTDARSTFADERDIAASLVVSNRLYALAAARAGDARLADFLRQLEPILIELANRSPDSPIQSTNGLRDYLRRTDLLFQVRVTQARVSANGTRET